jgi:hypothetical protein
MKETWSACCEEPVLQMETSNALKPLILEGRLEKPGGEKPVGDSYKSECLAWVKAPRRVDRYPP